MHVIVSLLQSESCVQPKVSNSSDELLNLETKSTFYSKFDRDERYGQGVKRNIVATSPKLLRKMNAEAVLGYALETEIFSATDLMEATGLTRATVLGLCDELVGLDWIVEVSDARSAGGYTMGRPARRYRLQERSGCIVGIDAGQHSATALVSDLKGNHLARSAAILLSEDPKSRLKAVGELTQTVLEVAGMTQKDIFVAVVGVPAPVDEHGGSPIGDGFWPRMNSGFHKIFPASAHVIVENDANLAALAERSLGCGQGVKSFAALLSGERFGAGLVVDDALLRGSFGGAGEMRFLNFVEGVGSADGLGLLARQWAAEAQAAAGAAGGAKPAFLNEAVPSAQSVLAAALSGEPAARAIVDRLGERLASVSYVLASLLGVEKVIVSGAVADGAQPIIESAAAVLQERFPAPVPSLDASRLGADGVVLGALTCGLTLVRDSPLNFTPVPS